MNDDFPGTQGNHDGDGTDAALEARIVAWALGEASAFEVAELERLVAAQPELALFKRRIEAVHGLLGAAAQLKKADTMHLAPERRAKVLAAIGAVPAPEATCDTPPPIVVEPVASRRRSFGPGWKSLRLYFGITAACMVVFVIVQQTAVFHAPRAIELEKAVARESSHPLVLEDERQARLQAVEEAKAQIESRKNESARRKAEYEAELVKRQVELVRAEVELQAMSEDDADAPLLAMEPNAWTRSYAGGITVPVHRNIGTAKAAPMRDPVTFAADSEPETVPAGGDDQRVELPLYVVKEATPAGAYTATSTLAGTRMRTELKDVGSSISVVGREFLADTAASSSRSASSYQDGSDRTLLREPSTVADAARTWSAGFDAPHSVVFGLGSPNGVVDPGPSPVSDAITLDEPALEVRGGPLSGAGTVRGFTSSGTPGRRLLGAGDQDPRLDERTIVVSADAFSQTPSDSVNLELKALADVARPAAPPLSMAKERPAPREADKKLARPAPPPMKPAAIDEAHAAAEPVSTFSLHVSDASFKLAQAALARGQLPDASTIRPEEFYNAFDYGDPSPTVGQKVGCRIEQAAHPFLQQRTLVRIAMKVANTGRGAGQPLRLTVLLDTSGSMEREDRVASVRRAIEVLASLLGPDDRITLIGFARQPRLLAEAVRGDETRRLLEIVAKTPADGGTNMEEALKLADELAQRHFEPAAQNRIVLLTDGAANLGNADPAQLASRIEALRGRGVAFDACGVGTDGLDDAILEALTRRGDGRYYVLDAPEDADAGFARQLAGAFRPAAKNVKVQVRFNPARVGAYRLLGFEKHRLREEDFRNDRVDAAELAAEEAAVAVYQVEVLPQGEGELGDVFVRFRDVAGGGMVERSWTIPHDSRVRAFDQATPSLQLAATAALLAEVLRGGALGDAVDLGALAPVVNHLKSHYAQQPRVQEMVTMFEQLRGKLSR